MNTPSLLRTPAALLMAAVIVSCSPGDSLQGESKKEQLTDRKDSVSNWTFRRTSGSRLEFTNGKRINTRLFDLRYIGQLGNGTKAPYLVYAGRPCDDCDSVQPQIYIYSPDQSPSEKRVRYNYPGTVKHNGRTTYRYRAFFGQVLKDRKGLMIYQEQFPDNDVARKSFFTVRVENGQLKHTMVNNYDGELRETLRLLKEGKCIEIEGIPVSHDDAEPPAKS